MFNLYIIINLNSKRIRFSSFTSLFEAKSRQIAYYNFRVINDVQSAYKMRNNLLYEYSMAYVIYNACEETLSQHFATLGCIVQFRNKLSIDNC